MLCIQLLYRNQLLKNLKNLNQEKIYHSGDNESILPYLTDDFAKRAYQATNLIYKKRTGNSLI